VKMLKVKILVTKKEWRLSVKNKDRKRSAKEK